MCFLGEIIFLVMTIYNKFVKLKEVMNFERNWNI